MRVLTLFFLCLLPFVAGCNYNPTAYKCRDCGAVYVISGAILPGHGARHHCAKCGGRNSLRVYKRLTSEEFKEAKRKGYYSHENF
jgi:DNA-directed RNA polymerase subunit RPC12/RpoP